MSRKLFRRLTPVLPTVTRHTTFTSSLIADPLSGWWVREQFSEALWGDSGKPRLGTVRYELLDRWRGRRLTMADLVDELVIEVRRKLKMECYGWE